MEPAPPRERTGSSSREPIEIGAAWRRWLESIWRESCARATRHAARMGRAAPSLRVGWSHQIHVTCTQEWSERTSTQLAQAMSAATANLARQSGTHLAMAYVVAAGPTAGRVHAHALLSVDPAVVARYGGAALVAIGGEPDFSDVGERVRVFIAGEVRAAIFSHALTPFDHEPLVKDYLEHGAPGGAIDGERAQHDDAGAAYLHVQRAVGDAEPAINLVACCPV